MAILVGVRLKYYFDGVLVAAACPDLVYGRGRGSVDSVFYLLFCYGLQKKLRREVESVDFMVPTARRSPSDATRRVRPLYVVS